MECVPVCWMRRDGGWAAEVYGWWCSARKQNELSGAWEINFAALDHVLPRAILDDDEERLEVIRGFELCARVMNNPKVQILPDQPGEDV